MDTLEHQTEIENWLAFCWAHPKVLCVEYKVPDNILPDGYTGVLTDVRVGSKKRAPDDMIYAENPDLRAKVARGNCVLQLNRMEGGVVTLTKYLFLIFALRKFTGGLGDEDDTNFANAQWFRYFVKDIATTKKIVSSNKENGEAAHIGIRMILGQTYFCVGSKNVHLLVRNEDDIFKYQESRFDLARSIARTFFQTVLSNPEASNEKLIQFMDENRLTAVAENVDPHHQHIVNLSHLQRPELRFLCWTKVDWTDDFTTEALCTIPIQEAIEQVRQFGFQTTNYDVIEIVNDPVTEAEELMSKIRREFDYEGKVLYFIDAENRVIGLIKKKTAWYIVLRAVREKVVAFSSSSSSPTSNQKPEKLKEVINEKKSWLKFSDNYAEKWLELSSDFANWLQSKYQDESTIRNNFPVIFRKYLKQAPEQFTQYKQLRMEFDGPL